MADPEGGAVEAALYKNPLSYSGGSAEDVSDDELKMVKTRAKANLVRSLDSNEGLVQNLAVFQTLYGDWRELFRSVDRIDAVSKADIRRVANQVFIPTNRTVGIIENVAAANGGAQ